MAKINKVAHEFKPLEGFNIPKNKRREALEEIADFVKEKTLSKIGDGKSPVSGGPWKRSLTADYKKFKSKFSSIKFANLEMKGDMLDDYDVVIKNTNTLSAQIKGTQAGKADGNNRGTYGKGTPNPSNARRFIPLKGEDYKTDITKGIKKIAASYHEEPGNAEES
jgi:hypothetical protein